MKKYTLFELNKNVTMIDGKECKIMNDAGTDVKSFTVREAIRVSLGAIFPDECATDRNPGLSFEKKMFRYEIAKKIVNQDNVELTIEQQAELKICIGKMYSGEALGFLIYVIEGTEQAT